MSALRDFLCRTNNFLDFSSPLSHETLTETSHLKLWYCFPFKVRDFVVTNKASASGPWDQYGWGWGTQAGGTSTRHPQGFPVTPQVSAQT